MRTCKATGVAAPAAMGLSPEPPPLASAVSALPSLRCLCCLLASKAGGGAVSASATAKACLSTKGKQRLWGDGAIDLFTWLGAVGWSMALPMNLVGSALRNRKAGLSSFFKSLLARGMAWHGEHLVVRADTLFRCSNYFSFPAPSSSSCALIHPAPAQPVAYPS
jgi:hypothetical protein